MGMARELPEPFRYHWANALGSLAAGQPGLPAAREDAKPLVERPTRWAKIRSRFASRRIYRPLASS
jgi:hypothetical protein